MTTISPNPPSPYADADPRYRHILPTPASLGAPPPGVLLPTACGRLAVVPGEPLRVAADLLPAGLCPACLAALHGKELPEDIRPVSTCGCGLNTEHDGLCALCRQDRHAVWWQACAAPEAAA
ncbi:hypothetical protein [Streptomyces sp. NPDC058268]|uniref:hypothetical protein n=1 Tax=Streptomyces sp. NPDC058268 TaxID=3346413 RepID=UPI0036EBAEA1